MLNVRVSKLFGKILVSFSLVCLSLVVAHNTAVPVGSQLNSQGQNFFVLKSQTDEAPDANDAPNVETVYETEVEEIPFETVYISDPTLVYNTEKVVTEGVAGEITYTYEIIISGGVRISKTLVEQKTTREVQNKVIHVGDDPTTPYGELIAPTQGKLTSCYGYRPNVGASNYHYGIDIAWKKGTPIVAADGGIVTVVKTIDSFGLYLCIDHGGEMVTLYSHLDSTTVKVGDRVARGQVIGYMGESGNATAPCLHFEVRVNGDRVNPLKYVNKSDIVTPES